MYVADPTAEVVENIAMIELEGLDKVIHENRIDLTVDLLACWRVAAEHSRVVLGGLGEHLLPQQRVGLQRDEGLVSRGDRQHRGTISFSFF